MRIITDSAADMSVEELQALGVIAAPLFIHFPEGEVRSSDISLDEFYDRLEAMRPDIPKTAQPSGGSFAEIYRELAEGEDELLSIHISSGLSGTANAARVGAEQVAGQARVHVWDTLTLSGGERFQVIAAALAIKAGWSLDAIQKRLAEIQQRTEVVFTLETVEYLARGGRIGRVQALAGLLLNIKPVIHVDHEDGKYTTVGKSRTMARAQSTIVEFLQRAYGSTPLWVAVEHGRLPERAKALAEELRSRLEIAKLETIRISPVLGVHTGPGVVGAAVVPMSLMSDLV